MRFVWAGLGTLCVGLGIVGAFLPLVPTVPFLLLATFLFAHSSPRLHTWIVTHPRFGPVIEDWTRYGAIRPRAKRMATLSIAAVFGLSLLLGFGIKVLAVQAAVLGCVLYFIWSRPSG